MLDYLIVGQGLAGSVLGYELLSKGKKIIVINDETQASSSKVAGGLFNPITGKNLSLTWLYSKLFPTLLSFFEELEKKFDTQLLYHSDIYRPFANEEQKKHFSKQIERNDLEDFIKVLAETPYNELITNDLGGMLTREAGWLDLPLLLELLREYFISNDAYIFEKFNHAELQILENQVVYKNIVAEKIIFCEGYYAAQNPLFNWLPYNPVKGETLVASIDGYSVKETVNQGAWILPIKNNLFRFGATYVWDDLTWGTTPSGRELLSEKVQKFLKLPFTIVDQLAGIRPATKDRRPFLGSHPAHPHVLIFNGLGTKGVSLAPYFAKQLVDYMENQKEINSEANIKRYYSLYSSIEKTI